MKSIELLTAWSFEPGIVAPLAIVAILYARGQGVRGVTTCRQRALFWSGWITLAFALLSPLHEVGESLFWAHMLQHEILMLIAAPLLVLAGPLVPMLHGMPLSWRKAIGRGAKTRAVGGMWHVVTSPFAAWWIHAAALWIWHFPPLFDATLDSDSIHAMQHGSFFLSALLFWWSLFYARGPDSPGTGVLYIFTTAIHTSILGALLTLSTRVWYKAYGNASVAWGLTPLEDQQLGGLIMWVPAGLVYLGTGLKLFAGWLRAGEAANA